MNLPNVLKLILTLNCSKQQNSSFGDLLIQKCDATHSLKYKYHLHSLASKSIIYVTQHNQGLKMAKGILKLRGFTLVELMITLSVAAVLMTLAAPSFTDIIKNNRLTTQYNELLASLSLARSESIKRGVNVIALSNNGASWGDGWTVFIDADDNGNVDAGEELRVQAKLSGSNTLNFARDRITYANTGLGTGIINGTFTLCDDRGDSDRKGLVVSPTGRVRHAIATDVLAACP